MSEPNTNVPNESQKDYDSESIKILKIDTIIIDKIVIATITSIKVNQFEFIFFILFI